MRTYKKYLYFGPISSGPDSGERITPSDHLPCAVLASYWSPDSTLAFDWPRGADGRDSLLVRGLEYQLRGTAALWENGAEGKLIISKLVCVLSK